MSERYSVCGLCKGAGYYLQKDYVLLVTHKAECPRCDGTGHAGDGITYLENEDRLNPPEPLDEL
jgi:DnaJ-class molecular chaperone